MAVDTMGAGQIHPLRSRRGDMGVDATDLDQHSARITPLGFQMLRTHGGHPPEAAGARHQLRESQKRKRRSSVRLLPMGWMVAFLAMPLLAGGAFPKEIELKPQELYEGFEARNVVLQEVGTRLALDPRVLQVGSERYGVVVTDPINLGPCEGGIGLAATVESVAVAVTANLPPGTTLEVETRSSPNRFSESGWSPWGRLGSFPGTVRPIAGRYLQLRMTLRGTVPDKQPAFTGITLKPTVAVADSWKGKLTLQRQDVQKIVRSPLEFHYERPNQPKLSRFRQAAKLDAVVADGRDDFEKLVRLLDWVGSGTNLRNDTWTRQGRPYPWDIEQVGEITPQGKLLVKGHCMSYAEVLITAATALGYHARHWAIEGFRDMGHEVTEIWVPSLGKWVYFDPSLTSYYFDKETKEPLNVIELHRVVAEKFLKEGEDMHWWSQGDNNEAVKARVQQVGGQAHVGCRIGPYRYGAPMPRDYDWGWNHGYMAAGFVQLTPRNDFHSHPENASQHFGGPARLLADGYPFWVDAKTPPRKEGTRKVNAWYTRLRDFYWTLDQATLELVKDQEGTLLVQFGQSMPFFQRYRVAVDGVEVNEVQQPFAWKLRAGTNQLEVAPVDANGKVGLKSLVEVHYAVSNRTNVQDNPLTGRHLV
jgi:hypothetical protein